MDSTMEVDEYESQLADVRELLRASPDDPSLCSLQSDLEELIAVTRQSLVGSAVQADAAAPDLAETTAVATIRTLPTDFAAADESDLPGAKRLSESTSAAEDEPLTKKLKKIKDFEIPEHLVPLDTDTEAEKNRKRRAIKALKNKWREQKKNIEAEKKQKTWHSFQKKKSVKAKEKSMFSTQEGDTKVGVVSSSGRHMTDFGERKRNK
jgi:survival of motor neuron-related-splicing factor 30